MARLGRCWLVVPVLVTFLGLIADGAGPEPGTACTDALTDLSSCGTETTLLACFHPGPACKCLTPDSLGPIADPFTIDMDWNSTTATCVSKPRSVCNRVHGAPNRFNYGGVQYNFGTVSCMDGLDCLEDSKYPEQYGVCGGTTSAERIKGPGLLLAGLTLLFINTNKSGW